MSKPTILINLSRCIGCWTCSMGCKVNYHLPDNMWRSTIRTLGSGEGIDRPGGVWPNLHMEWMPVYSAKCTLCEPRTSNGELPYCVNSCPNGAMFYGDLDNPESDASKQLEELKTRGYRIYTLPAWEEERTGILYANR